jgi:hypothetical protein
MQERFRTEVLACTFRFFFVFRMCLAAMPHIRLSESERAAVAAGAEAARDVAQRATQLLCAASTRVRAAEASFQLLDEAWNAAGSETERRALDVPWWEADSLLLRAHRFHDDCLRRADTARLTAMQWAEESAEAAAAVAEHNEHRDVQHARQFDPARGVQHAVAARLWSQYHAR